MTSLKFIENLPDPLTVNDICRVAGVTRPTVQRWFGEGLDSIRIGGVRRIPKEAFVRFIEVSSGGPGREGEA